MLTKEDLEQIRLIVQAEGSEIQSELRSEFRSEFHSVQSTIQKELSPMKKDISTLKKDVTKIKKDINYIVDVFDRQYLELKGRVERLEDFVHIPTSFE